MLAATTSSTSHCTRAMHYVEVSKQRVPLAFDQIKYDPIFKGINSLIF
jgi:hypothetical protein